MSENQAHCTIVKCCGCQFETPADATLACLYCSARACDSCAEKLPRVQGKFYCFDCGGERQTGYEWVLFVRKMERGVHEASYRTDEDALSTRFCDRNSAVEAIFALVPPEYDTAQLCATLEKKKFGVFAPATFFGELSRKMIVFSLSPTHAPGTPPLKKK